MTTPVDDVRVRPVALSDGPFIEQYAADARVAATSHVPHPYPAGGGTAFAAHAVDMWRAGRARTFAVTVGGAFAGIVSLMAVEPAEARAQLGYWIAVPYWGRGVATAAVRLVVTEAFGRFGLVELSAGCLAENPASARVLEKIGFQEGPSSTYRGADQRFAGRGVRTFRLARRRVPGGGVQRQSVKPGGSGGWVLRGPGA